MKRNLIILITSLLLFTGCGLKRTVSMYKTRQPYYGEITVVSMG